MRWTINQTKAKEILLLLRVINIVYHLNSELTYFLDLDKFQNVVQQSGEDQGAMGHDFSAKKVQTVICQSRSDISFDDFDKNIDEYTPQQNDCQLTRQVTRYSEISNLQKPISRFGASKFLLSPEGEEEIDEESKVNKSSHL